VFGECQSVEDGVWRRIPGDTDDAIDGERVHFCLPTSLAHNRRSDTFSDIVCGSMIVRVIVRDDVSDQCEPDFKYPHKLTGSR
jgi:hypothetical protein